MLWLGDWDCEGDDEALEEGVNDDELDCDGLSVGEGVLVPLMDCVWLPL